MSQYHEFHAVTQPPEPGVAHAVGAPTVAATLESPQQTPSAEDIVRQYETEGWVKELPTLQEQAADITRQNTFEYIPGIEAANGRDPEAGEATATMTEHEGLAALDAFLATAEHEALTDGEGGDLSQLAAALRKKFNFIGEKEYQEGAAGTKALWQSYLDKDPELQLCVYTGVSKHDRSGLRKSDEHLVEQILGQFSQDELAKYDGRIVTDLRDITQPPEHTKIIIPDDWTMSGNQINRAEHGINEVMQNPGYGKTIEVNLLAASEERLQEGMGIRLRGDDRPPLPVKAYYKARTIDADHDLLMLNNVPITGLHSSGDYGFEHILEAIAKAELRRGKQVEVLPLANIVRTYRNRGSDQQPAHYDDDDSAIRVDDEY